MTPDLEVSRRIAASAEAVFVALTDVTRMGEWSPECVRAEWSDGFSKPVLGAMFMGHNVNGDKEWSIGSLTIELAWRPRSNVSPPLSSRTVRVGSGQTVVCATSSMAE